MASKQYLLLDLSPLTHAAAACDIIRHLTQKI